MAHRVGLTAACAAVAILIAACSGGGSSGGDTADTTAPAATTGLGTTVASGTQINLAWTASTDNVGVTGYRVERCQGASCSTFTQIATPTATSFNDTGLSDATSYSYRVRAADATGNLGAYSSTVSATTPDTTPPVAPTSLSATASSQTQIDLTWTAASDNVGVTGYRVERCQGASCNAFTEIATPTAASFSDTGLTASTSYNYRVRAVDTAVNLGPYSNIASATTLPPAPAAPTGLSATPGNTQALLSWPAVTGATSYNVYTSPTSPATLAGAKTTVSTPNATLPALTNGTPVYAVVTSVNAAGESAPSNQTCAVPTAGDTTGLTLYDALCGDTLDGNKWQTPLVSRGVAGGAMVLSTQVANMESRQVKFLSYQTLVNVNEVLRVSALRADITVPADTASRSGTAEIRAVVRLSYQPPVNRLQFPGGSLDQLAFEIGLADTGSGLRVVRALRHCDSADCRTRSTTGISFTDPAEFTPITAPGEADAPATYDTTYTIGVTLNETTGVFSWVVTGGTFNPTVSGTADPGAYLAANANWSALGANPLSTGGGFVVAAVGTRAFDESVAGGSAGSVTAMFDNVRAGFNNGAPGLFDDFSGTGDNSGPTELGPDWLQTLSGRDSVALSAGSLIGHIQGTSLVPPGFTFAQSLALNNPAAINTLQADVTATTCGTSPVPGGVNRVQLVGTFFNDGSPGTTAPNINQANSLVGDVRAVLQFDCTAGKASIAIIRLNAQNPSTNVSAPGTLVPLGSVPAGGTHTLRLTWDPSIHSFVFRVDDGTPLVVDPTVAGGGIVINPVAVVGPANAPQKSLSWNISVPSSPTSAGATASLDFKVNNVFTAP